MIVRADRKVFRPRIGRRRALSLPWSHSIRLLAYCSVSCTAAGRSSAMAAARSGARSVVTCSGSSWTASLRTKNLRAAARSRRADTRTSMTWPWSSTARYTYRHTYQRLSRTSRQRTSGHRLCRHGPAASMVRGVKCWTQRYSVTWSSSMPRSASSSSRSRYDSPKRRCQPDRQQDHIRREPVAREGRSPDFDPVVVATGSHANSLIPTSPTSQCNRAVCQASPRS
jgi:hypothetical protein